MVEDFETSGHPGFQGVSPAVDLVHPLTVSDPDANSRIQFLFILKNVRVPTCQKTGIDRTACMLRRSATDQQDSFLMRLRPPHSSP